MFSDDAERYTRMDRERSATAERARLAEARAAEWEARYNDVARLAELWRALEAAAADLLAGGEDKLDQYALRRNLAAKLAALRAAREGK